MGLADGVAWERENEEVIMGNKVGELVADWDALEVGDQAVFEGFSDQNHSIWEFIVGKKYTVGVDADGDKGFISDGYIAPEVNYDNAFKFRLTHKVSDAIENKLEQSFPDFPFKIRNGDNPAIRQWLKDNGVVWCDGDDVVEEISSSYNPNDGHYLRIDSRGYLHTMDDEVTFLNLPNMKYLPEISINIQPAVVTGWEIVENISEKELQLKEKIAKLTAELEETQEELNNL